MRKIAVTGREVRYRLVRRPGMRTIRLTLTEEGLKVSCPPRVPLREVEETIRAREPWLRRHAHLLDPVPEPLLVDGSLLPLMGGEVELGLVPSRRNAWRFRDEDARLTVSVADPGDVDRVVEHWYRAMALRWLGETAIARAPDLGVPVPRLTIRDTRSRWGSCSSRAGVSLSWRLVMAPPEIADYVVVHELAHLREMSHSPAFWEIVRSVIPGYESSRAWLRHYGDELLRRRPRSG